MSNKLAPYKNLDTIKEITRAYEEVLEPSMTKDPFQPLSEQYREYLKWSTLQDSVEETLNYKQFLKVYRIVYLKFCPMDELSIQLF